MNYKIEFMYTPSGDKTYARDFTISNIDKSNLTFPNLREMIEYKDFLIESETINIGKELYAIYDNSNSINLINNEHVITIYLIHTNDILVECEDEGEYIDDFAFL